MGSLPFAIGEMSSVIEFPVTSPVTNLVNLSASPRGNMFVRLGISLSYISEAEILPEKLRRNRSMLINCLGNKR